MVEKTALNDERIEIPVLQAFCNSIVWDAPELAAFVTMQLVMDQRVRRADVLAFAAAAFDVENASDTLLPDLLQETEDLIMAEPLARLAACEEKLAAVANETIRIKQ